MPIAGDPQVLQITKVGAEFEGMVIVDPGPIVDKLELLHQLNEWAVAVGTAQKVSKLESALSVGRESRHALSGWIICDIQARGTRIPSETSSSQRINMDSLSI